MDVECVSFRNFGNYLDHFESDYLDYSQYFSTVFLLVLITCSAQILNQKEQFKFKIPLKMIFMISYSIFLLLFFYWRQNLWKIQCWMDMSTRQRQQPMFIASAVPLQWDQDSGGQCLSDREWGGTWNLMRIGKGQTCHASCRNSQPIEKSFFKCVMHAGFRIWPNFL